MLVLLVSGAEVEEFDLGDWIYAVDDIVLESKKQYYKILKEYVLMNQAYKVILKAVLCMPAYSSVERIMKSAGHSQYFSSGSPNPVCICFQSV